MKNVLRSLAKSVLIPLALIVTADTTIHLKKMFGSGAMTLIISFKEMSNIMKIVKSLGESGLLIKDVSRETDKNEVKEQKGGLINMLLVTFRW